MDTYFSRNYKLLALMTILLAVKAFIDTSRTVEVLEGSKLTLNCTIWNATWWFQGTKLTGQVLTKIGNVTELRIANISGASAGVYWCGLSWQQGFNVSVLVGGQPTPPQGLHKSIADDDVILLWSPSQSTGGLPNMKYQVLLQCINSSSKYADNRCAEEEHGFQPFVTDCENDDLKHIPGKALYSCKLEYLIVNNNYSVYVVANNGAGKSRSRKIFVEKPLLSSQMYPVAPINLTAKEQEAGNVYLSWKGTELWKTRFMLFKTVYYKNGSNVANKPLNSSSYTRLIMDLHPDAVYHFSVRAMICSSPNKIDCSVFGRPTSIYKHMSPAAPSQPPTDLNCSVWVRDGNVRNITLTWKAPPKESRNGALTNFTLSWYYKGHPSLKNEMRISPSRRHAIIPGVRMDKDVAMNMQACTVSCGGISEQCSTPSGAKTADGNGSMTPIIVGIVVTVAVFVILIAVVAVYLKRRTTTRPAPRPLPDVVEPYTEQYDRLEDQELVEEYDIPCN